MKLYSILNERRHLNQEAMEAISGYYLRRAAEVIDEEGKTREFIEFLNDENIYSNKVFDTEIYFKSKNIYKDLVDKNPDIQPFLDHLRRVPLKFYKDENEEGGHYGDKAVMVNTNYWESPDEWNKYGKLKDKSDVMNYLEGEGMRTMVHEITHAYQDYQSNQYAFYHKVKRAPKDLQTKLTNDFKRKNGKDPEPKDTITHKRKDYLFNGTNWVSAPKMKTKDMHTDFAGYWGSQHEIDARFVEAVKATYNARNEKEFWERIKQEIVRDQEIPAKWLEHYKRRAGKIWQGRQDDTKAHFKKTYPKDPSAIIKTILHQVDDDPDLDPYNYAWTDTTPSAAAEDLLKKIMKKSDTMLFSLPKEKRAQIEQYLKRALLKKMEWVMS